MKVTVVGAGAVGASCAEYIAIKNFASQVVILDIKDGFAEGKAMDYKLQTRVELGEALPSFGKNDGEAAERLRTKLKRNKLWKLYRIETQDIGEVLVPYSFRHRYAKQSHAQKFPLANICNAMGHTLEVHLQNYSKFLPDDTGGMYDKANKVKV